MSPRKLFARLVRGSVKNVAFDDVRQLVEAFGFELKRVSGSHHIFAHARIPELINPQDVDGQDKPYQIKQLPRLVERYALSLEERP